RGLRGSLNLREGDQMAALSSIESLSFGLSKWLNAVVQTALLEYLAPETGPAGEGRKVQLRQVIPELETLPEDVQKIRRRMDVHHDRYPDPPMRPLRISENVSLFDPNVAIQSAFKNALLARRCGLVTSWTAQPARPLSHSTDLVIQLDPT